MLTSSSTTSTRTGVPSGLVNSMSAIVPSFAVSLLCVVCVAGRCAAADRGQRGSGRPARRLSGSGRAGVVVQVVRRVVVGPRGERGDAGRRPEAGTVAAVGVAVRSSPGKPRSMWPNRSPRSWSSDTAAPIAPPANPPMISPARVPAMRAPMPKVRLPPLAVPRRRRSRHERFAAGSCAPSVGGTSYAAAGGGSAGVGPATGVRGRVGPRSGVGRGAGAGAGSGAGAAPASGADPEGGR